VYEFETLSVQALPGVAGPITEVGTRLRPGPSNPDELSQYAKAVAEAALRARDSSPPSTGH